jgi:hypothetical protein
LHSLAKVEVRDLLLSGGVEAVELRGCCVREFIVLVAS